MVFIIGITLAFFLEFLLLSKKGKSKADIILAFWLFFLGLHLFLFYVHYAGFSYKYPVILGFIFPLPLVHGPFLYLYISTLTHQLPGKKFLQYIHFAPPVLMYLYLIHFFIKPAAEKIDIIRTGGADYAVFQFINWISILVSGVVYVVWTQVIINRHRRIIKDEFTNIEKINLSWLQYLIIGIGSIWAVVLSGDLIFSKLLGIKEFHTDLYVFLTVVLFVIFLGYFGLKQTDIFIPRRPVNTTLPNNYRSEMHAENKETEKYAKSGLQETDAEHLHKKLLAFMEIEKPYLNSDISLSMLAERLDVHPNYLSQVINERENKNLYDYINGYRIEEFKRLISDPKKKNYTILSLAYDCGFNSKSAFNNFFKKATGQTPSEYMKLKK